MQVFKLDLRAEGIASEDLAEELERIAEMVRKGYTSGEVWVGSVGGWWDASGVEE